MQLDITYLCKLMISYRRDLTHIDITYFCKLMIAYRRDLTDIDITSVR